MMLIDPCRIHDFIFVVAKGEIDGKLAGRYASISRNASLINPEVAAPTVLIESASRNIVVKNYDSMTVVMSCLRADE